MTQTILVTGASGFVASHIIREFLEAGYSVRGTVRSESSAERVKQLHSKHADQLSFATVEDITTPGAFNEAVKGVDGVIHTASPFIIDAKDYQKELFEPAEHGTRSILKAIKELNPSVKRVVIISSFGSVLDVNAGLRPGYAYTEADWNPMTTEETEKAGPSAAYLVSKTIAEKAAWDFVETEKPNFSVSAITPPMIYGPMLGEVPNMSKLNTSSADIYRLFNGSLKEMPDTDFYAYIDVRDIARAHLLVYESPAAANQRYLVAAATFSYQLFCDIIRKNFPELASGIPENKSGPAVPGVYTLDTSKAKKELGMTYRGMEETVVDTVTRLRELEKEAK